jgi:PAS domain S-box-containing protein
MTYANPAFMRLLEVSDRAEAINQPFLPERFWCDPEERTQRLGELQGGNVEIRELALKTSKGKTICVNLLSTFTQNIHGQISGTQGILYDITQRKRSEEALRLAYQKLEGAHRDLQEMQSRLVQQEKLASIGQLAAGVAHEMNTPVGFVASNFETLEGYVQKIRNLLAKYDEFTGQMETLGDPRLRSMVDGIGRFRDDMRIDFILQDIQGLFDESREGLERVTSIVQNLRDFSRIDQPGSRDEYDLNKGIEATLVVARNEIKYDAEVETELSEVPLIFCHSGQINQVLLNILVNAAQAIRSQGREDRGTITIRTYASDGEVVCEIADDGPGIAPEHLSKVFDPFFTTKPPGKGTGLGLSVSYDIIVHKHNGTLLVESTVGQGAKFTIRLPLGTKENEEQEITSDGKENGVVCGR